MPDQPLGQLAPVSGRAGTVSLTLTDLTYRDTDKGRRFPYSDFGAEFIMALHDTLVSPRTKSFFQWTLVCPSCKTSVEGIRRERVRCSTKVALKRIPAIRVDLEMPGVICPGCSRPLVRIDDRAVDCDLGDALIDAFKSVQLKPR